MKTKVTVLGQKEKEMPELKKIQFFKSMIDGTEWVKSQHSPEEEENIILIRKNYAMTGLDIMYSYDGDISLGCMHLGHFNDGIV